MAEELTPKEKECLSLAGRRLSDAEIAQRLNLAPKTVSNHLSRAYVKLGVRDRIRAAKRMSEIYPEYRLPIEYENEADLSPSSSAHRTDASAGGLAGAFAKLPPPPPRLMRLVLIAGVAIAVSFVFAGVTVIMSVSTQHVATLAPENAR